VITLQERVHGASKPSDWRLDKLHQVLRVRKGYKNEGVKEDNLLSLSYGRIVQKDINSSDGLLPENFEGYQIVEPGNIVLRLTDLQNDKRSLRQGLVTQRGIITSAYDAVEVQRDNDPRFWFYSLFALDLAKHYYSLGGGVRQSIKFSDFPNDWVYRPDLPAQHSIANFLDRETARIDLLIEKKKRLVNLVSPRFEALIAEARETGVWQRFGFSAIATQRPIPSNCAESFTPLGLYNRGRGFFKKVETDFDDLGDSSFFFVENGDLVFSGQFAWEGAVGLISQEEDGCIVSHRYPVYVGKGGVLSEYLFAYFRSHHGRFLMDNCSRGAAGRNRPLNTRILEKEKIPIPPLQLQQNIREIVVFERQLKAKIMPSIDRLREYRSALITAAVTGQINVAEWGKVGTNERQLDAIQAEMEH
jgi:type I restriction enzyme S subunit